MKNEKDTHPTPNIFVKSIFPLPMGRAKEKKCPECGSNQVTGVTISATATERDPDCYCLDCKSWS